MLHCSQIFKYQVRPFVVNYLFNEPTDSRFPKVLTKKKWYKAFLFMLIRIQNHILFCMLCLQMAISNSVKIMEKFYLLFSSRSGKTDLFLFLSLLPTLAFYC